ncbi:MAG TPA: hypothetical protein VFY21_13840 [Xanthobacteraceae bacterium]|nr:hypothetical protein [Xanthobacteraceae bacterium]
MPAFHRALFFFLAMTVLAVSSVSVEAQADRRTLNKVSQLIVNSYKHLTHGNDTEAAREDCEKAQAIEEKSKDPFISATVAVCFGDVEDHEENIAAACRHYAEALENFEAVPAKHSARRTIKTHMNVTKGKRLTLSCGA